MASAAEDTGGGMRASQAGPSRGSSAAAAVVPNNPHACQFCRRRKIRCNGDGAAPCQNCVRRQKDCVYSDVHPLRASKPTVEEMNALRTELSTLRSFVSQLQQAPSSEHQHLLDSFEAAESPSPSAGGSRMDSAEPSTSSGPALVRRQMHVPVDGHISYHGPSSIFDQGPGEAPAPEHAFSNPGLTSPEEIAIAEEVLCENAAKGRHTEMLDLASGRLDFDGVSPEIGMDLLAIHWGRQHHALLITYRPAFMRDMASGGKGKYFSKLLLNAIYFGASKFSSRAELRADPDDARTAGFPFLKRINELIGEAISRSRITTIQALLLLASSLFALGQKQSSWLYSGIAFRMLTDLGLHLDNTAFDSTLSTEDIEIRRRVFWAAYCFDKIHSLYQGRPAALQEYETQVPLVFCDLYEETELWRPWSHPSAATSVFRSGVPTYSVSTFLYLCNLMKILDRAINSFYTIRSFSFKPQKHLENLQMLEDELQKWWREMPAHLLIDVETELKTCPTANILALNCIYTTLVIIVHRPFVEQGHFRETGQTTAERSWRRCSEAADRMSRLLQIYSTTLGATKAPFLISYAAYIAATIHVRVAAQQGAGSEAMMRLNLAMEFLDCNGEVNTGVLRAKEVLMSLMNRLEVSRAGPAPTSAPAFASTSNAQLPSDIDMAALIKSFTTDDVDSTFTTDPIGIGSWMPPTFAPVNDTSWALNQDVLYGLMAGGNVPAYESLLQSYNL